MRSMIAAASLAVMMFAAPSTSFAGGLGHMACPLDMLRGHFARPARAERAAKPAKAAPAKKVAKAEKAPAKPKK